MLLGALEVGGTKMVCAIGDETGTIFEQISLPTKTPEETMPLIIDYFKDKNIAALGVGCFGPVDLDKKSDNYGHITSTPKLAWVNYNMVGKLKSGLGVPIGFDTDVNGSALGEATWGATQGIENSIYITVGTGVGVGVIINGKPYHGMMHPEGGHILLGRHPSDVNFESKCPYHENCLEGLAAGPAIEKRWGKKAHLLADRREVWELEAYYLGQAICNYIVTYSPERIVLGGGVMAQTHVFPLIRGEVRKQLGGYIRTKQTTDLETYIVPAGCNDKQGIMGCLRLAMNELGM